MNIQKMGLYAALGQALFGVDAAIENVAWSRDHDVRKPEVLEKYKKILESLRAVRVQIRDHIAVVREELGNAEKKEPPFIAPRGLDI